MPQAVNLTVKNAAGVDQTFTLLSPAPGYGQPADWMRLGGATSLANPEFTLSASKTKNASRKTRLKLYVPAVYTSVTTGLPVVSSAFEFNGEASMPDTFPDNQKDDAVAFLANLIATALVKACIRDGLPAN